MDQTTLNNLVLSAEQHEAVYSTFDSLVVSAAAGSGKTRVLVERYLRHVISDGLRADQILTITFTRKAAAEMKRRIVDRLSAHGLTEQAQMAETGPIQTIHGFCERLLRENAFAAGLDPEFEILSEGQSARLMEQSIQEVLALPDEDGEESSALIQKLAGRRVYAETLSPHARLESAIRDAIYGWRGTGISLSELEEAHRNPIALLARWRDLLLENAPPEVRDQFETDHSNDSFATKLERAYKAVSGFKGKPRFIHPTVDADLEAAQDTCGLVQLVCQTWAKHERKQRQQQALDFTALEEHAVQLIRSSEVTRARLQAQYPVVLIDEAQDLNPVQYALLNSIKPKTEMFVGDHQQSIYGFRQADVELFARKLIFTNSTRLSKNFRSQEGVLRFVDHLFGNLWEAKYEPMATTQVYDFPGVELWVQKQRDTALSAQWIAETVEERRSEGGKASDIAVLVRSSRYAMGVHEALERLGVPARVSGGTEQFFARLEVRDLANALEALTNPYDDFALAALLRSPFVGLSLDAIVHFGKHKPIIEALKQLPSPMSEDAALIAEFRGWFDPLSAHADRLAAWEIIGELFSQSPYLGNLARRDSAHQRLANVRKLLSLAVQDPDLGPQEFAERIREIQSIRHKEGDAPAGDQDADEVTIMTVHKSKGLEFPVVILPDTHQKMSKSVKDVEVDPWMKVITTKFGRNSSMFHEWLAVRRQQREQEEEWRVLYVAFTRAKEKLCVVVNPGAGGDKTAEKIAKLLKFKDSPPPGVRLKP